MHIQNVSEKLCPWSCTDTYNSKRALKLFSIFQTHIFDTTAVLVRLKPHNIHELAHFNALDHRSRTSVSICTQIEEYAHKHNLLHVELLILQTHIHGKERRHQSIIWKHHRGRDVVLHAPGRCFHADISASDDHSSPLRLFCVRERPHQRFCVCHVSKRLSGLF